MCKWNEKRSTHGTGKGVHMEQGKEGTWSKEWECGVHSERGRECTWNEEESAHARIKDGNTYIRQ